MGVLLRIVVGLGITGTDTWTGNALGLKSARFRTANTFWGIQTNDGVVQWLKLIADR
jgi:hypothetical protein